MNSQTILIVDDDPQIRDVLGMALDRIGRKEQGLRLVEESVRLSRQLGERAGRPHPSVANRLTYSGAGSYGQCTS